MPADSRSRPLVALAGASGFVGTHLREHLSGSYDFRAISRSPSVVEQQSGQGTTEWRQCDLYSLPRVTEALEGCDYGIYLVHSMAPSSRLIQSRFEDTDLLLADNFIRAAEAAGLKHVVYLSGLMPKEKEGLSPHLKSRLEVEGVLRSRSVKVTVLRAGLIFGPGGSSFSLLINLVRRLPIMLLPAWVRSQTHSIDITDVCQAFELSLVDADLAGGTYDLGGHEAMSYREMIKRTAALLGKNARFINFPYNAFGLSKQWVALFGSVPPALVGPLQESLQYDLVASPNPLLDRLRERMIPFEESFARSVDEGGNPKPNPRSRTQAADQASLKAEKRVRSVQRMGYPKDWSAKDVATEYGVWLTRRFRGIIRADTDSEGIVRFSLLTRRVCLLELSPTPYSRGNPRRCAFYISGGILSRQVDPPGRLEFRLFPELPCMIASIHGFAPTLPWWLYANTQARLHLRVMRAFRRHMSKLREVPRSDTNH
ncbi:nucleoside-diphosphate sugar epimerase [Coraliomargarita sinensis]|uniref:Nucleoside-diphosphate sugar epimerase n=1 Tax=Coraliomargarita sinensis TaxID=2174842 RepID=A0A317ZF67_9BACT|nr:NAD(P)H-binding protein [Coraliomargarita sinensis]PXA02997.1 nucleoside-diphosphate sugar epimerase [Coraliomargarita sinensis]